MMKLTKLVKLSAEKILKKLMCVISFEM